MKTRREAGCDGFVAKPYDVAGLADALDTILRDGRAALPLISAITPLQRKQKAAPA
jgi:DNA-binding NarL/FixJ family response regulator